MQFWIHLALALRWGVVKMGGIVEGGAAAVRPNELDRDELERYGKILDQRPLRLHGQTVGMELAEKLLFVRTRGGWTAQLKANGAQLRLKSGEGKEISC